MKNLFSSLLILILVGFTSCGQNTISDKAVFTDKPPIYNGPDSIGLIDYTKLLTFIIDANGKIYRKDSTINTYITFDQLSHQLLNEQNNGRKGLMVFNIGKDYSFLKNFLKKLEGQGVKMYNIMPYEDMLIESKKRKAKNISTK
jgi:hypothetical protein